MYHVNEYFAKSLSRSLMVIRNDILKYCVCKSLLVAWISTYTACLYIVPLMRHSASRNNGVTVNCGLWVVQDHWKWRRSIDHIRKYGWSITNFATFTLDVRDVSISHLSLSIFVTPKVSATSSMSFITESMTSRLFLNFCFGLLEI